MKSTAVTQLWISGSSVVLRYTLLDDALADAGGVRWGPVCPILATLTPHRDSCGTGAWSAMFFAPKPQPSHLHVWHSTSLLAQAMRQGAGVKAQQAVDTSIYV